ncbi:hypothetical protein NXS08_05170 [Gleimia sp. 6138-11-ORH1]|nr:hypothetical protein [Gleimia sp. 6138-11-ORH1]MCS4484867.1 hypothetical protein [Gleimia sp. 6138-11-ORH1]
MSSTITASIQLVLMLGFSIFLIFQLGVKPYVAERSLTEHTRGTVIIVQP